MNSVIDYMACGQRSWGRIDCVHRAVEVFYHHTGLDLKPFVPRYGTRKEAIEASRAGGGLRAIAQRIAADVGLRKGLNEQGDIGVVATRWGDSLAINIGHGNWCAATPEGVVITYDFLDCWRL